DSPRARMSCGHVVTPMSLTKWCQQLLKQGKSRFVCGQSGCNAEWPYQEVCKMALLTPEERKNFETTMALNACPGCMTPVTRGSSSNLYVCCHVCSAKTGRSFGFCWQCLREWKGRQPRSDRCKNDNCHNSALKTLRECPEIKIDKVKGCPSVRACPTCGSLIQHTGIGCKTVICPRCKMSFCFGCLKNGYCGISDICSSEDFQKRDKNILLLRNLSACRRRTPRLFNTGIIQAPSPKRTRSPTLQHQAPSTCHANFCARTSLSYTDFCALFLPVGV
uniref:Probable protein ariadne-2 n=1 Tax=Poecilia latipinna TaxID=48699 RepID=A0A3B3U578_9TELE